MYSSDYEKLWFLHKTEGKPKGVSINSFSMRQGIFYCDFNTWFVKARKDIISVQIEGAPSSDSYLEESPLSTCNDEILKPTTPQPADKSILDPSEEYKLLWPIDVNVMSVNPLLKQTPGYEK